MKHLSGATVNGRKPIGKETVHEYGVRGHAKEHAFKSSEIAGQGAHDPGGGKHTPKPGESKPELNGPKAAAERVSTGTTAEEQKKRLAAKMYPSSRGLREYGAGTT